MKFLTNRDKALLKLLYYNRFATTTQLKELFFRYKFDSEGRRVKGVINKYPEVVTSRRIRKLRSEGLIKSFYAGATTDMVHAIDEKGVMVVADILGTTFNKLYFNPKEDLLGMGLAGHSILLNDLYIKLLNFAEDNRGEIVEFKLEKLNSISFEYMGKKVRFMPDAFLVYKPNRDENRARLYFIELDNDTERPKQFSGKIEDYEAYYDYGEFQKTYGTFPKVITICPSQGRIDRLKKSSPTKLSWEYYLFDEAEKFLLK